MTTAIYESTADWATIAERLRSAERVAVTSHRKVDGDAIGSIVAVVRMLRRLGVAADAIVTGALDPALAAIAGDVPLVPGDDGAPDVPEPEVIAVVDTGAWSQLEPIEAWLRERSDRIVGIDHHARGDDVAAMRIVDPTASSTTAMLLHLVDALGLDLDPGIAEPLFLGLATDTGWFRHSNGDAPAFRAGARLLEAGVDKPALYQAIEETHRPARLGLAARLLGSLRFVRGGEVAISRITQADYEETGGGSSDLVGLVNQPMSVGSVRISILATESEPGVTKFSFRGKPAGPGWNAADVNEIAGDFGGGGHVFAAGGRIAAPIDEAIERVVGAVESRPSLAVDAADPA